MTTPADELRTAAQTLRDVAPEITGRLAGFADPVADWLDHEAKIEQDAHLYDERESCLWCGEHGNAHALAVARQINGTEGEQRRAPEAWRTWPGEGEQR